MTCARGRVDIIISSGTAISRPLAGREEKTLTAQSTGTFDGTTCASTSRVADCNAKWSAADDSSMLRPEFVPASLVRTRRGSSPAWRRSGIFSHLGRAALDHHETALADVTRLHGDGGGGAGVGGLELFDIIVVGHCARKWRTTRFARLVPRAMRASKGTPAKFSLAPHVWNVSHQVFLPI